MRKTFSRLRALRESRDLRQLDVCIRTGLSPATVWRAEQPGGGGVSEQSRLRIAQCLGVSPSEIFDQPDSRQSR
jgi:transcriptional regulator with XRE-family HTH domain